MKCWYKPSKLIKLSRELRLLLTPLDSLDSGLTSAVGDAIVLVGDNFDGENLPNHLWVSRVYAEAMATSIYIIYIKQICMRAYDIEIKELILSTCD